jgi:NADPH:quinone reductase-like Zn-dependent oxidoreductase
VRAAIITGTGGPEVVRVEDVPDPEPEAGDVLVEIATAALNRRDIWIRTGERARAGAVLGSDAAGLTPAGEEVVVVPYLRWGDGEDGPAPDGEILGVPHQGTHAERIAVPAENVRPRPQRLSWEESAALPLAGLTAWRALVTRGGVSRGARVLITGAGGGAATFLVQIAHALGAEVLVTSSAQWKIDRAVELGASGGVLYTDPEWPAQVGEIDVAVDSAGGPAWEDIFRCLRTGGTLVSFGDTSRDTVSLGVSNLYFGQWNIHGTTMGSPREFDALLAHVERAAWRPVVDSVYRLEDAAQAHQRMDEPDRFGKVVLRVR